MAALYQYWADIEAVENNATAKMVEQLLQFKAVTDELITQGYEIEELRDVADYLWYYWAEKVPAGIVLFRCVTV